MTEDGKFICPLGHQTDLPNRVEKLEFRMDRIETTAIEIRESIVALRTTIPMLATRTDLESYFGRVTKEIDAAVVSLLKDAIKAYPAKLGLAWTVVGSVATVVAVVVSTILIFHK